MKMKIWSVHAEVGTVGTDVTISRGMQNVGITRPAGEGPADHSARDTLTRSHRRGLCVCVWERDDKTVVIYGRSTAVYIQRINMHHENSYYAAIY